MIHNLDINPTNWIPDKSRVIPRMILRSLTRRAVVFAACFNRRFVKGIHKLVGYIRIISTIRRRTDRLLVL